MASPSTFTAATFFIILAMLFIVTPVSADPSGGFVWAGHQDIFLQNTSSTTVNGYYVMDHIPKIAPQTSKSVTISSGLGQVNIGSWIIPLGSPVNGSYTIAPGIWAFHFYIDVSSTTGVDSVNIHLLNRSASGVETDLFYGTAISQDINPGDYETIFEYVRRNVTNCNAGDRLVMRINATSTSPASKTMTFYMDGNTRASRVSSSYWISSVNQFPIPLPAQGEAGNDLAYAVIGGGIGGFVGILYWKRRNRR